MIATNSYKYGERSPQLKIVPETEQDKKPLEIQRNRNNLYRLRMLLWRKVEELTRTLQPEDFGLTNRDWEMWMPIITVAKLFAPDKIKELLKFVKEQLGLRSALLQDEMKERTALAVMTLWQGGNEWIKVSDIAEAYNTPEGTITSMVETLTTPRQMGEMLRSLGFKQFQRKRTGRYAYINRTLFQKVLRSLGIENKRESQRDRLNTLANARITFSKLKPPKLRNIQGSVKR